MTKTVKEYEKEIADVEKQIAAFGSKEATFKSNEEKNPGEEPTETEKKVSACKASIGFAYPDGRIVKIEDFKEDDATGATWGEKVEWLKESDVGIVLECDDVKNFIPVNSKKEELKDLEGRVSDLEYPGELHVSSNGEKSHAERIREIETSPNLSEKTKRSLIAEELAK